MMKNPLSFNPSLMETDAAKNKLIESHFISFIIPCYNCEDTVEESILSIYQQDLTIPFEVICIDDSSTDHTKIILEKCRQKYPGLQVYVHDCNKGGGASRNKGAQHANGTLIFNLDSDNVLVPNSINQLVDLIDLTGCDIASFQYAKFFDGEYRELKKWTYDYSDSIVDLCKLLKNEYSFPSYQGNYLYTRKCFDLVGGYPEDCGALDTTAFGLLLLAAGCKIAIHPDKESYYWHRTSENSYWNREQLNNAQNFQKSLNKISEVFDESFLDVLSNEQRAEECLDIWTNMEFKLKSPKILNVLFKAYQYKKEKNYFKAAEKFSNFIKLGCKSQKIHNSLLEMIDLNNQIDQVKPPFISSSFKEKSFSFVTYSLDGGRFGDQLINYMKAVWISDRYKIPLLYRPFLYSDQLKLSEAYPDVLNDEILFQLKKIEIKDDLKLIEDTINQGFNLYSVSFFSQILNDEDWENEAFRKKLTELIQPKQPIAPLKCSLDHLKVAIHIRSRDNRFDSTSDIEKMPTKFPPHSFYLNGLKQIADLFKEQSLYVHIFTDDPFPLSIKEKYIHEFQKLKIKNNIIFHCREAKNDYNINVLEDFFHMMQCDCIIHPDSMFSLGASILSGPIIEITPPAWNVCRTDEKNQIIRDNQGDVIVDNLIYFRSKKGSSTLKTQLVSIDKDLLSKST